VKEDFKLRLDQGLQEEMLTLEQYSEELNQKDMSLKTMIERMDHMVSEITEKLENERIFIGAGPSSEAKREVINDIRESVNNFDNHVFDRFEDSSFSDYYIMKNNGVHLTLWNELKSIAPSYPRCSFQIPTLKVNMSCLKLLTQSLTHREPVCDIEKIDALTPYIERWHQVRKPVVYFFCPTTQNKAGQQTSLKVLRYDITNEIFSTFCNAIITSMER